MRGALPIRRFVATLLCGALLASPAAAGAADASPPATAPSDLQVSISRDRDSVRLGSSFSFQTTVTNTGARDVPSVVEHLNIASVRPGVYVDPEDWSQQRTQYLGSLGPGESTTNSWTVKPVNGGTFGVFVTAFPADAAPGAQADSAVSPVLRAAVAERRTLNPEGVLPLAVGIPAFLGLLALGLRLRRRD